MGANTLCGAVEIQWLGAIQGRVRDPAGVPRMGASVVLLNRYEKVVQRTFTNPGGAFRFNSLLPDLYTVRVSLSTFVPASRSNIQVRAGTESYLSIQLANLFSSIELVSAAPGEEGLLSEDWKWVLRSAGATRPVLRYLPRLDANLPGNTSRSSSSFEITRGLVRVSAGDQGGASLLGAEPDLGTAFALATTLFGANQIQVSGNIGYASSVGTPVSGFRTRYSHTGERVRAPDVELTVRQLGLQHQAGQALLAGPGAMASLPMLRTMSLKLQDRQQVTGELNVEYGVLLESVIFLDRLNLLSPFARLSYDLGGKGLVQFGYASGTPPGDLINGGPGGPERPLQQDLAGLALFPRVSLDSGRARVQQSDTFELGYQRAFGNLKLAAVAYQDQFRNFAMTVAAPAGVFGPGDLLPDIASRMSIFNFGNFATWGYMASATQSFGGEWSASFLFGEGGALDPGMAAQPVDDAAGLRARMRMARRNWMAARIGGMLPAAGTRISASYTWLPGGGLAPVHASLTQRWQPLMGLNIQLRQPLPAMAWAPGRIEMTADLRNMLAQGYVPVAVGAGRSLHLIQFPRTVRGGFNFIF
jgi:hypothetical protein